MASSGDYDGRRRSARWRLRPLAAGVVCPGTATAPHAGARRPERSLRERAEGAERESRRQLYTALLEQARATVRSGELGQRFRRSTIRRAAAIHTPPN
jgi:hypothetical protein